MMTKDWKIKGKKKVFLKKRKLKCNAYFKK